MSGPAAVEDLVGLGTEDVDHGCLGCGQPAAIVDGTSVLTAHNVFKAGSSKRSDIPERKNVKVHVQPAEFVDGIHAHKIRLVLDFLNPLAVTGRHCGRAYVSYLDGLQAENTPGPFVFGVVALDNLLDRLFREVRVQKDGLGLEVDDGRVYREEMLELEMEFSCFVLFQLHVVHVVGYFIIEADGYRGGRNHIGMLLNAVGEMAAGVEEQEGDQGEE